MYGTFTMSDVESYTGCQSHDVSNWTRAGGLNLPFLNPEPGKARRYGRANLYEFALVKALLRLGFVLGEIKPMLHDRLFFVAMNRRRKLKRPFPGVAAFVTDPVWLGDEFLPVPVRGDLRRRPFAYFIDTAATDQKHPRLIGYELDMIGDMIAPVKSEGGRILVASRVLDRVDEAIERDAKAELVQE
jgi:hypothetical protein